MTHMTTTFQEHMTNASLEHITHDHCILGTCDILKTKIEHMT
jgi:hypothetical protein